MLRRTLLLTPPALLLAGHARAQAPAASAAETDPRLTERSIGRADAPVTVQEFFSLTCGHCAAFHANTMPQVKRDLVETGRVRILFRDFPLDQVALAAAVIARSLPAAAYEPFIGTLFATQNRWAFQRGGNPVTELKRLAAVAGLSGEQVDAALADEVLARGVLEQRLAAQQRHNIASTPSFLFGTRLVAGNIDFNRFAALVTDARG
jgi:protein-disulfide isomerase